MNAIKKLILVVFSKKRIVGWLGAAAIALGAAAAGMQSKEVREAVCGAQLIEVPAEEK